LLEAISKTSATDIPGSHFTSTLPKASLSAKGTKFAEVMVTPKKVGYGV